MRDLVAFISEKTTPPLTITQPLGGVRNRAYNEKLIAVLNEWAKKHDLVLGVCDPTWGDRLVGPTLSNASSEELLGELGRRFDGLRDAIGMLPGGAPR